MLSADHKTVQINSIKEMLKKDDKQDQSPLRSLGCFFITQRLFLKAQLELLFARLRGGDVRIAKMVLEATKNSMNETKKEEGIEDIEGQ